MLKAEIGELCKRAANGNEIALQFLDRWCVLCHAIDDLIDARERPGAEAQIEVSLAAIALGSHPYMQSRPALWLHIMTVANAYADSVKMAASADPARRSTADVLRHAGNELILVVAAIEGGWGVMRGISEALRVLSYTEHHNEVGEAI